MAVYYCLIVATVIFSFFNKRIKVRINLGHNREWHDKTVIFFFAFMLVLLILRSDICGCDLVNYKSAFYQLRSNGLSWPSFVALKGIYGFESGYIFINLLVGSITDNFQIFMGIIAIFCVVPIAYLYYKESDNQLLSIGLFLVVNLFSLYFSTLRQVIAMAFVVPAYYFAKSKKLIRFILIVIFACFFHKSAFIIFAIYPLLNIRIGKKHLFFIVPVYSALLIFNKPIFMLLAKILGYEDATIETTGAYSILLLLLLLAIYSFVCVNDKSISTDYYGLRNVLVFSLAIQMFAPINNIAMRMNYYNMLLLPITISKICTCASDRYRSIVRIVNFVMIIFFLLYYMLTISPGDILKVYPYVPFWAS